MTAPDPPKKPPRTFFLNERQELASFDREGGGRQPDYVAVNWSLRASNLERSLRAVTAPRTRSPDPLADRHHFIVAVPVAAVEKYSKSKKAQAQGGIVKQVPNFVGEQSKILGKLGMDLIEALPGGRAAVHLSPARIRQLLATLASLPSASSREQNRWIYFDQFEHIDWHTRVSDIWFAQLQPQEPVQAVVRMQPVLGRAEANDLLHALSRLLKSSQEKLLRAGRDFSGRYWCSGLLAKETIQIIAQEFHSIQSLHPPLLTPVAASSKKKARSRQVPDTQPETSLVASVDSLPTVAVVDTGIPEGHQLLGPYRRPGGYRDPDLDPFVPYMGDHGSLVASCVVFGRLDTGSDMRQPPRGTCNVYDVMVSRNGEHINDDIVVPALEAVIATSPDVRVFNLSFGGESLYSITDAIERRERLMLLEQLDNLALARDVLLVLAAGNARPGIQPDKPYPHHVDDPRWGLGALARSFNGIVCGAHVDVVNPNAIAKERWAPSPFTRIGPGLCSSPVPGFGAPGGDALPDYRARQRAECSCAMQRDSGRIMLGHLWRHLCWLARQPGCSRSWSSIVHLGHAPSQPL